MAKKFDLNANKRFRDQDIDDTANDADINLPCEVNFEFSLIYFLYFPKRM